MKMSIGRVELSGEREREEQKLYTSNKHADGTAVYIKSEGIWSYLPSGEKSHAIRKMAMKILLLQSVVSP